MTTEADAVYVLDTHVLIWYFTGSHRLSPELKDTIDRVRDQGGRLLVPTIVLAEGLDVAEKGRVDFDFREMHRLIEEEPEFEVVGFSHDVFLEAMQVEGVPELHDRVIVATARFYKAGVLSQDKIIRSSGEVERR